ncbi:MAG: 2-iminoacetate synthase ThiH [Deltaproteobacteria bacterium]|nr:2-iminoacetate synthase ThiH [Deltaproteobacteria bacterium]
MFETVLNSVDRDRLRSAIYDATAADVARVLQKQHCTPEDFPVLISPAAAGFLETMAARSRQLTTLRFGKTVRLYAPLYISNECVNACAYCGFNIHNVTTRTTLGLEEIISEAAVLHRQGFRHLLLVSGEHRGCVPVTFIAEIARQLRETFAGLSIEVYPMEQNEYALLVESGITGIAVYQETYDRERYARLHHGPKADFSYRLATPERAARAGLRELGIGALLGLSDHRIDLALVALHAAYLMKTCWQARISVSFPRIRKAAGNFTPAETVTDRQLAQAVFALRLVLPDSELVISTRESRTFRNGMAGLGITRMSAGSRTNPGGYSIAEDALEQFAVDDRRSAAEVAAMLDRKGLEPVWKDFDRFFLA